MQTVPGGRMCDHCHKKVVNMTKWSWARIEQEQAEHGNALCGMYTQKQLDHWGHEVPASSCAKKAATTALFLALAGSSQSKAQNTTNTDSLNRTIIEGVVWDLNEGAGVVPLIGAYLELKGTDYTTTTDQNGRYRMDITEYMDTAQAPALIIKYVGYIDTQMLLADIQPGENILDVPLESTEFILGIVVTTKTHRIRGTFYRWIHWRRFR
ncbi:MAG: hypothetical protein R2794_12930 [Chitinophagales bacterium]